MANTPTISVVIPLYNKQDYIARCINSVRAQTFTNYQIVVVDDGSTDDGANLAASLLGDSDVLVQQPNGGVSAARNRGMATAQGDLIAFLDADDEWYPSHLANLDSLSQNFQEAGIFGTGYQIRRGRLAMEVTLAALQPGYADFFASSGVENIVNASCAAIRKSVLMTIAGFAEGQPMGEDIDFLCRVCLRWPLAYHPQVTSIYHREVGNSAAVTHGGEPNRLVVQTLLAALQRGEIEPEVQQAVKGYIARNLLGHAEYHLATGGRERALQVLEHEMLTMPQWRPAALKWRLAARFLPRQVLRANRRGQLLLSALKPRVAHGQLRRLRVLK